MSLLSISTALVLTVLGLALARRSAAPTGAARLGGVALITGTLVGGVVVGGGSLGRIAVAVAAAVVVGAAGLLEDGRTGYVARLAVQTAAAAVVVAAGIRTDITSVAAIDVVVSVLGIVAVTNAYSLFDVEEALPPAFGAISAAAIFVLAALSHQTQLAHLAGALAGACVGALVYRSRGGERLGNCGTHFIGFVVSVGALALNAPVGRLGDALVPLLLLSLPVLNLLLVVVGRSRRNLSVPKPAADQFSQRLGRGGVAVLVVLQGVLALLAVMTGRLMLLGAEAAVGAAALVAVLFVWAVQSDPYDEPVVGLPRRARQVFLVAGVLVVVATAAAGLSLLAARGPLRNGADTATTALNAARAGDYQRASALFADSERFFRIGRNRLQGPLPSLGLAVPGVSSNIRAARLLAAVGDDLAASGRTLATDVRPDRLRMQGGAVPLAEIARIAPALRDAADVMTKSERRIHGAELPYLFGPVRDAVATVEEKLHSVSATTRRGADAAELAPRILGGAQPRRYLLVIQNSAESRATGGFIGNFGELVAENGRITLAKFGAISTLRDSGVPFNDRTIDAPADFRNRFSDRMPEIKSWLHVNITPDFPTAARLMESLYPQSGGQRVDGVLAVDPVGLSALLKLTGPVSDSGWPEPLTAQNIVRVTTRDQYERNLNYVERRDFLGAVAETVWRRVSSSDLGTPYAIAGALGPATAGRHIQFSLRQPGEARFVRELGIDGGVAAPRSDSLMFVTHNAAGNKVDVYLRRTLAYRLRVEPDGDGTARVSGVVDVTLHNDAPSTGRPLTVLGDTNLPIKPGENFSYSSLYSPLNAAAMVVNGKRYPFRSDKDLGEFAHSTFLRVPPNGDLKMQALLAGRIRLVGGDTYVLDVAHQARLAGDHVEVSVELPQGWEIVAGQGFVRSDHGRAVARFDQQTDRTLSLRIRQRGISGLRAAITD